MRLGRARRSVIGGGLAAGLAAALACGVEYLVTDRCMPTDAVVLEVRDAATGAPAVAGARGAVRDGAYEDSLRSDGDGLFLRAAFNRPGTYAVSLRRAGYQDYDTAGVRVTSRECRVDRPALLDVRLVPVP